MGIRKTIATVIAAAMVLSMTACANNEKPNNEGVMTNSNNSSTNRIYGIEDDVPVPPKQTSMWDVIPEIPVTDASAFTYKYDSELGGMVVTDYLRESPKVRIPDMIEGEPVVKVDFSEVYKELTQLVMPDSVKEFELSYTAKDYLQYVNIPNSVTEIDAEIFRNRSNLISVYITNGTTAINKEAFSGCKEIKVTYKGETYVYEYIQDLYDAINCGEDGMLIEDGTLKDVSQKFTEITIPDSVTNVNWGVLNSRTNLTSINVVEGNTVFSSADGLLYMKKEDGSSLELCPKGRGGDITLPDGVTEISTYAFSDCTDITSVTIPDSVNKIGNFSGCTSLTSINVANGNAKYCSVDGMLCEKHDDGKVSLEKCPNVKAVSITIPNSVTEIYNSAFSDCTSLTSVIIPNSVIEIDWDAFINCKNIQAAYKGTTYDYDCLDELYDTIKYGESLIVGKTFRIDRAEVIGVNSEIEFDPNKFNMSLFFKKGGRCEMSAISEDGNQQSVEGKYKRGEYYIELIDDDSDNTMKMKIIDGELRMEVRESGQTVWIYFVAK